MMFAKRDVNGEPEEDDEEDYSDPEDDDRSISSGSSSDPGSEGEDHDDDDDVDEEDDGEDGDFERAVPVSKKRYRDSDDEGHDGRHEESSGDEGNGDVKKTEVAAGQETSPHKKVRTEEGDDEDDNE